MKKILTGMSIALLLIFPTVIYSTETFESQEKFGNWTTFYYLHPEPQKVPSAISYYSDSPMYKSNATLPMMAFFAALFKNDEPLMQKAYDETSLTGSENSKIMLISILGLVNNAESRSLLEKAEETWSSPRLQGIIGRQLSNHPKDVLEASIGSPLILDMLWAIFFATGSDLPVKKIISVIALQEQDHGQEIMVGGAPNWSLRSNAQQHKKVYEICKQELAASRGVSKQLLSQVIAEADKNTKP